jgi:hypothetical protein
MLAGTWRQTHEAGRPSTSYPVNTLTTLALYGLSVTLAREKPIRHIVDGIAPLEESGCSSSDSRGV